MAEVSTLNGYKIKDKKAIRFYNTLNDMKSDITLKDGMQVKTYGYYENNDGGGASYKIVNDDTLTSDNGSIIELENGLFAKLITEKELNIRQFGAKGNSETDDTQSIQNAIDYAKNVAENSTEKYRDVIFPYGEYIISDTIEIPINVAIKLSGKCTIKSNVSGKESILFKSGTRAIINTNLTHGTGMLELISNIGRDVEGTVGIKIGDTSNNTISNVIFNNINVRNFYCNIYYYAHNVWNITFNNCISFHANKSFVYGVDLSQTGNTLNSGERITFENCTFTQNLFDCVFNGTTWSQTNFHNCSFDFSNVCFYNEYNENVGYGSGRYKISCNQCHFEGIGANLDESDTTTPQGIVYCKNMAYAIIFSISDSTFAINMSNKAPLFYSKTYNQNSKLLLNNIFILSNKENIYMPLLVENILTFYNNINTQVAYSSMNAHNGNWNDLKPISKQTIINNNPFLQNLTVGSYPTSVNTIIGDYKIKNSTGLNSIECVADNEYDTDGKKLIVNYDTEYSGQYNTNLALETNDYIAIDGGQTINIQPFTNAYLSGNGLDLNIELKQYDNNLNEIKTTNISPQYKTESNETALPLTQEILLQSQCKFIKYLINFKNGSAGHVKATRDIKGLFIYSLNK